MRRNPGFRQFKSVSVVSATCAMAVLCLTTACGGGGAAPTPAPAAGTPANTVPSVSPQRPPLASPAASPSSAVASASTPTPGSPGEATAGESYEIQPGDTLATIANQFYGDPTQWRRIYDANKDAIGPDPDKLKVGTKLTIPPKQ